MVLTYREADWVSVVLNNPLEHGIRIYSDPVDAILEQKAVMVSIGERIQISVGKTKIILSDKFCIESVD